MSIDNPITRLTQQDLLDLLDRVFPPEYLAVIKSVGPGYELLQAYAAIFSRLSFAVQRLGKDSFIDTAEAGERAHGRVRLFREGYAAGAVTVKVGTIVRASRTGKEFETIDDVDFGGMDLGPHVVRVRAIAPGYEYDVRGQRTTAVGDVLPGEIDAVSVLVEDPPLGDVTIQVEHVDDITGGKDEALAALGRNRGVTRQPEEDVSSFRERVRRLPDTISPDAVGRVVANLLRPFDVEYEIIETWEISYQTCWDAPTSTISGSPFDPSLFVFDDPDYDGVPFRNRWLGEEDFTGAFIVVVENIQPMSDTSMAYDDWTTTMDELVSSRTGGLRAVCAYDVPTDFDFGALRGGYDGSDLGKQALYKGLWDTLQEIKPAGVFAVVELRGE